MLPARSPCRRLGWSQRPPVAQHRLVPDPDAARTDDVAVQRRAPVELEVDLLEHADVLLEGVGIEGRHHAAAANLADAQDGAAEPELAPHPLALGQPFDAVEMDVGAEAPPIDADGRHAAV